MTISRARIEFQGIVQGVGFRPFLHQLAAELGLVGWALNTSAGVLLELEGNHDTISQYVERVESGSPPLSRVLHTYLRWLIPVGYSDFSIKPSEKLPGELTLLCPDVALCPECARELADPKDRRFRYPFINCTNCGPRYTIVSQLPYDRPQTTMRDFPLCLDCQQEYSDLTDRRYHAQPVACPVCGPHLWLETDEGEQPHADAISFAAKLLLAGAIIAVKGLGGFQLACRADLDEPVLKLRQRKGRSFFKPLAVMVRDMAAARELCAVSAAAADWLASAASPVVLMPLRARLAGTGISSYVAPRLDRLGLMLPYTPLHRLLLDEVGVPLVMTSGNLSDEPICADNDQARQGLAPLCDALLMHDRAIEARCDDSVLASMGESGCVMFRHSRGFSPFPIALPQEGPSVLALGGDIKTTFAVSHGRFAFLSPHLGDGEQAGTYAFFRECWEHYRQLFHIKPLAIACDAHPGYHTGRWAEELAAEYGVQLVKVLHHHAHLVALQTEHHLQGEDVAIVADGTGYGRDGMLWGGEVLRGDASGFQRLAHLDPLILPGGDSATKEPWRIAVALLQAAAPDHLGPWLSKLLTGKLEQALCTDMPERIPASADPHYQEPTPAGAQGVLTLLERRVSLVQTTALGRLLDGLAALLGVCLVSTYEGQAPMELEALLGDPIETPPLPQVINPDYPQVIDWRPLVRCVVGTELAPRTAAWLIHRWVADALLIKALPEARSTGRLLASGGCLQNTTLRNLLAKASLAAGIELITHREIPPGDGGLALGSLRIAQQQLSATK